MVAKLWTLGGQRGDVNVYDHRMEVMGRLTHSTLGEGSTGCGFCVHVEYALGDVYLDWSDSFLGERSLGEGRPGGDLCSSIR